MLRDLYFRAALLALAACVPEIPEGVIACTRDATGSSCPDGWYCRTDLRCYRELGEATYEAGVSSGDAGARDAEKPREDLDAADRDAQGAPAPDADSTADAAELEASTPEASVPVTCRTKESGIACDDERFCNGAERCDPDDPAADRRGCVAGRAVMCPDGQACSEARRMCSACSDGGNDGDGDQSDSSACGGDDCDDTDPTRHPGATELCDGKDNDCDGNIDGAAADTACMQSAPAGATARCVAGACAPRCTDPDFDLIGGACVRHDDCPTPNPCAVGTCVDGMRDFHCTCPAGYTGTGSRICSDIDECADVKMNNCDNNPKACVNTAGGFTCRCPARFEGQGIGANGCRLLDLACRRPPCPEPP